MSELVTIEQTKELVSQMADWDDAKRKDFVDLFAKRATTSKAIEVMTVEMMLESCLRRKILSGRHVAKFCARWGATYYQGNRDVNLTNVHQAHVDRPVEELKRIAADRSKETLESLPSIQKALEILDPATLGKMRRLEKLQVEGEDLIVKLEDASESITMTDFPDMTVKDFMKMVEQKNEHRIEIARKLNKVGKEGTKLETDIHKALYKGIPGLADAVIEACDAMMQNSAAMGEMYRRVEEKVKFGDSEEATQLLKQFEGNEMQVTSDIAAKLRKALDHLKIAKVKAKAKLKGNS